MTTLAVIPARLGATRLPRKPLRLLGGAPLIARVWQRTLDMRLADEVVVATDSDEIAAVIREHGGRVAMTRPEHPSGTDRVAQVADLPGFSGFDVFVNVQGDEPFLPESALRGAIDMVQSGRFQLGTAAGRANPEILANPNIVKVVCANDGRALYFSRAPIPFLRDGAEASVHASQVRQHLGVYAYSREGLRQWVALPIHPLERIERLEQLRPLAAGMPIGVVTVDAVPPGGVDTEEDLVRANVLWHEHFAGRA